MTQERENASQLNVIFNLDKTFSYAKVLKYCIHDFHFSDIFYILK